MINVHPSAVVGSDVELGENVTIGPNSVVGDRVSIGSGTVVGPNVFIGKGVKIGSNNEIFPFATVGGKPQLLVVNPDEIGGLTIGDNNTIREQVTIHPSIYRDEVTAIGNNNLLMIGVHIGHDCVLEDSIVLSNYVQISGHYPPKVRGVNKRGLGRAGLDEDQQKEISRAYKRLYRHEGSLLENAKSLAAEEGIDENVKAIVEAIFRSSEHRFGRYLEQFRH